MLHCSSTVDTHEKRQSKVLRHLLQKVRDREKVGKNPELIGTGGNFLNRTPIAQVLRSRTDKWDLKKLERFCKAKCEVKMVS